MTEHPGNDTTARPWQAKALAAVFAVEAVQRIVVTLWFSDGPDAADMRPVYVVWSAVAVLATIGLARRSNLAWSFSIIAALLSIARSVAGGLAVSHLATVAVGIAIIWLAATPAARDWYRKTDGRSQLSVSFRRVALGVVFVLVALVAVIIATSA